MFVNKNQLVEWAEDRLIPSFFDRTWEARTKVNPVAMAILCVRDDQRHNLPALLLSGLCFLCVMATPFDFAFGVPSTVFFIGSVGFLASGRLRSEHVSAIAECKTFCADFGQFLEWSGLAGEIECLAPLTDEQLEAEGTKIMTMAAGRVLEAQEVARAKDDVLSVAEMTGALTDLANKYEALQRLGLVSGGYQKYYRKAEKLAKQCAEAAGRAA